MRDESRIVVNGLSLDVWLAQAERRRKMHQRAALINGFVIALTFGSAIAIFVALLWWWL